MVEHPNNQAQPESATDRAGVTGQPFNPESIEAIQFQPTDGAGQGPRFAVWHYVMALAATLALFIFWFLFTTKSVSFEFNPDAASIEVSGGLSFELGNVMLLREGEYTVGASAPLYQPLSEKVTVGPNANQTFSFDFVPMPGFLTLTLAPPDAVARIDGQPAGARTELSAGEHEVSVSHPRYQPFGDIVVIEGLRSEQALKVSLVPNWADVTLTTIPEGADVFIDGAQWHEPTPTVLEALAGEREIEIRKTGYKTHRQRIFAQAEQPMALETIKLVQADAQLEVVTTPEDVGVIVNGQFVGQTPLMIDLRSDTQHSVQLLKAGYATTTRSIRMSRGETDSLNVEMRRQTGLVKVTVIPKEAELWLNGQRNGGVNRTLSLPVRGHEIEIKLAGYAPFRQTITPKVGLTQEIKVRLLTQEEARLAAMKPSIQAPDGQTLLLFQPFDFTAGASRREPGRRANETLRDVGMSHLFYLATHETTNKQFRSFASGHDSGKYVETSVNGEEQPAVNLGWHDAAAYCNWLSQKEGLPAFYNMQYGKVVGTNPKATGYRLPTEAEWAWAARTLDADEEAPKEQLRFPWGSNLPPPDRHGNYADRAASSLVGRVIFGYNDNYAAAAPIGTYKANQRGLYDMGGNVAEWVNDFYEIPGIETVRDPAGPSKGEYHVIKGSSWMHGTITELRYSFRDYGIEGRQDVGFRIARYVEPPE